MSACERREQTDLAAAGDQDMLHGVRASTSTSPSRARRDDDVRSLARPTKHQAHLASDVEVRASEETHQVCRQEHGEQRDSDASDRAKRVKSGRQREHPARAETQRPMQVRGADLRSERARRDDRRDLRRLGDRIRGG